MRHVFYGSGIAVLMLIATLVNAQVVVEYQEVVEPSLDRSAQSMRAYQAQWQQVTRYTMNANTPGFTETAGYNVIENGEIVTKPFYRFRQGPVVETHNDYDFLVDSGGKGFFAIQLPNRIGFTKDGRFTTDENGRLITKAGNFPVLGQSGEILIPQGTELSAAATGQLYMDGEPVDKMRVVVFESFESMQKLQTLNGSVFYLKEPVQTVSDPSYYKIRQGFVEETGFMSVLIGDLQAAIRGYEASAKAVTAINKVMGETAQIAAP